MRKARLFQSAFVRHAVETVLRHPAKAEVVRKARKIYAEILNGDRALAETYLPHPAFWPWRFEKVEVLQWK